MSERSVGDFEDFAVLSGLRVGAFDRRTAGRGSVRQRPVVTRHVAGRAPGFGTVENDFFARENEVMRAGHRHDFGSICR